MNNKSDEFYLKRAVDIATQSVRNGGGPFGAVIVTSDGFVIEGNNQVTLNNDPTAHAEVTAIRNAGDYLGTFDLQGCVLYSSCEPCPMCLGASLWSRVDRVVFAADRWDAAAAGFDDAVFYEKLASGDVAVANKIDVYNEPFEVWAGNSSRVDY